ncbi:MAG: serine hydrolase [bacterium]|nr:serine hydrolase [bacterium]
MKRFLITFALMALLLIQVLPVSANQTNAAEKENIMKLLKERVDTYKQATGIVVGLIDEKGNRVYCYGKMAANREKVTADTLYEIGSITKVFTAIILADMAEKGELKLTDPVSKYLPKEVKLAAYKGREITLMDLVTHTSGLPRMPGHFAPADPFNPYADYTVKQLYTFIADWEPTRAAGESHAYSNLGVGLLGHVLALKAGMPYETLVKQRVLNPLEMEDTMITVPAALAPRFASGHNRGLELAKYWDLPTLAGAGALRSTANDLLVFLAANMGLHKSTLAASMKKIQNPSPENGGPYMEIQKDRDFVAMGWHIRKGHGSSITHHGGGTGGFRTFIAFDAQKKQGVVVLANSENDSSDLGLHLLNPGFQLHEFASPQKEFKVKREILEQYVGQYQLTPSAIFTITLKKNRLHAQLSGQPEFPVYAKSDDTFYYKVVEAVLKFSKDDTGTVSHLTLFQNGQEMKAKKIVPQAKGEAKKIVPPSKKEVKVKREILEQYVGKYQLAPSAIFTIGLKKDGLHAQLSGQPVFPVYAESDDTFFYKAVEAVIKFSKDDSGTVSHLTLFQNGQEMKAKKIE